MKHTLARTLTLITTTVALALIALPAVSAFASSPQLGISTTAAVATPDGGAGGGSGEPIIPPEGFYKQYHRAFKLAVRVCRAENNKSGSTTKKWARFEAYREALDGELGAAGLPEEAPFVDWFTVRGLQEKNGTVARDGCSGLA